MQTQQKIRISTKTGHNENALKSNVIVGEFPRIVEGRYEVRLAKNSSETAAALRLRHKVFSVEIGGEAAEAASSGLEFDSYDFRCRHLVVIDRHSGETVGTYRLNTIETAGGARGFYSSNEFTIGELPV